MARKNQNSDSIHHFHENGLNVATKTIYFGYGLEQEDHELDHKLAMQTIKNLAVLDTIRPEEPIHLIINCQGGDVDMGLAVYDAMRLCQSEVIATVTGVAWSMAAWVLQAADQRRITENSSLMIHDGAGPKDKFTRKQDILCRNILLDRIREKHPKYPVAKLQRLLDVDSYFTAQDALELGLVDEVL